jgi:hypothetical protein
LLQRLIQPPRLVWLLRWLLLLKLLRRLLLLKVLGWLLQLI